MKNDVKKRLEWLKLYETIGNAGVVCLRCGITRPTQRKWFKRFRNQELTAYLNLVESRIKSIVK